jgi:hypothetical protein
MRVFVEDFRFLTGFEPFPKMRGHFENEMH